MLKFAKFHGFGNDYIVIERRDIPIGTDLSELAIGICERHTGAGSDGIAVLTGSTDGTSDFECEIINPDGSIAGFSGNGTRCAVAYLYHTGVWQRPELRLKARSGVKNYRFLEKKDRGEYWFEAEIGQPVFESSAIPVVSATRQESVTDEPITVDGEPYTFAAVNVGNPVACIFVDDFDPNWRSVGRSMEVHEAFPDRANIVFVKVIDRGNIEIRIWERAAGETSSSGTCSSGAAVLAAFTGRTERSVDVHAVGGVTRVVWSENGEIVITGRADYSYSGEWPV